ncbi:DUF1566 domain-containing protein [Patescibacteria group bacterium]
MQRVTSLITTVVLIGSLAIVAVAFLRYSPVSFQGAETESVPESPHTDVVIEAPSETVEVSVARRIVSTGLSACYDNDQKIACPTEGQVFFGQDGNYAGVDATYTTTGGVTTDVHTGLMWEKAHNPVRISFYDAKARCEALTLAGYEDWRMPSISELFSIVDFSGGVGYKPYLDEAHFDIEFPEESILEGDPNASTHRVEMMGQTWSGTVYTGNLWGKGEESAFFYNFLDGRIKAAETNGRVTLFHRCVRGDAYGGNGLVDNKDGTVMDHDTGLMWQKTDDGIGRDWEASLGYCEGVVLAGYDDWRLPDAKELQSIVDYSRNDPALDIDIFDQKDLNGWFWSSTTHGDDITQAVYVCFGKCVAADGTDVHGAGAQRSDPKAGDPQEFTSQGGQGDDIRIENYARCVRKGEIVVQAGALGEGSENTPQDGPSPHPNLQPVLDQLLSPSGGNDGPPQEAIQACMGRSEDSGCTFDAPHGTVSGACRTIQSALTCVPN